MYQIMKTQNLLPSDADFEKAYQKTLTEYIDAIVEQSLISDNKTKEDFDDAGYAAYVENCKNMLFTYYDDAYFVEATYYTLLLDSIIDANWFEVSTLDERRAYPIDK